MRIHHFITFATIALIVNATRYQYPFDVLGPATAKFKPLLTPDLTDIIQEIVDAHQIPGLALAVVRKNGHLEFGNWGKKSEDGSRVTADVC